MDISSETIEGDADTSESSESSASSVSSEDDEESEKEVASAPKAVNGNTKKIKVDKVRSSRQVICLVFVYIFHVITLALFDDTQWHRLCSDLYSGVFR